MRELQARTGFAPRTVQVELKRLTEAGILERDVSGNRTYYRVNRQCPILPELRSIFAKTVGLADVLRRVLEPLQDRISAAFVYGSFAKGTATADSDVDLIVIGTLGFAQVVELLGIAQDELGREINPTVYPVEEARRKLASSDHFLVSVLREPKIYLIGGENELAGLAG